MKKNFRILFIIVLFIFAIYGFATAEDKSSDDSISAKIPDSGGVISFTGELNDPGNERARFRNRYHNKFDTESFILSDLKLFQWFECGTFLNVESFLDFNPSGHESLKYSLPGFYRLSFDNSVYDFYRTVTDSDITRRDSSFNLSVGDYSESVMDFGFVERQYRSGRIVADSSIDKPTGTDWKSRDIRFNQRIPLAEWDLEIGMRHRDLNSEVAKVADADHTNINVSGFTDFCRDSTIGWNVSYNQSNVAGIGTYNDYGAGLITRLPNAFGIDRFVLTSKASLHRRNDNIAKFHPSGQLFDFNLGAKYRPSRNLRLSGAYDVKSSDRMRPNRDAIIEANANPLLENYETGYLIPFNMWTHRGRLGGTLELADNLDFTAKYQLISRQGMENTDFPGEGAAYLLWNKETKQDYILRYTPENMPAFMYGDFELKYSLNDRNNRQRNISDADKHLTVNMNGSLNHDIGLYLGWGIFESSTSMTELGDYEQDGTEYGGGFNWGFHENWTLFTDYWKYDVSGADGMDGRSYLVGLEFAPHRNWEIALEYEKVDETIDDFATFNSDYESIILTVEYRW